jgi:hypothetical protein
VNHIADKISRIREQFQTAKRRAGALAEGQEEDTSEFTNFHKFDNDFHDFHQNFDNFNNSP